MIRFYLFFNINVKEIQLPFLVFSFIILLHVIHESPSMQIETLMTANQHIPRFFLIFSSSPLCNQLFLSPLRLTYSLHLSHSPPFAFCSSTHRVVLHNDLQVEQQSSCCVERLSERRSVTLQCSDLTTRSYNYTHIISCECRYCTVVL